MVTNAKPRGRPVNLSMATEDFGNVPCAEKMSRSSFSVVVEGKIATKSFELMNDITLDLPEARTVPERRVSNHQRAEPA